MKIQEMKNGQQFITLPKKLTLAKSWRKGDDILISLDRNGDLILKKKEDG